MVWVLAIVAALIIYGSLYPFDFKPTTSWTIARLLGTWDDKVGRADLVSNVGLLVPYGYVALIEVLGHRRRIARFVLWGAVGVVIMVGVQVIQFWLPARTPSLSDVVWNLLGYVIGAGIAAVPWLRLSPAHGRIRTVQTIPFLLLACWLAYRLFPYVPSLDFGHLKDGLKGLYYLRELTVAKIMGNAAEWAVACWLIARAFAHGPAAVYGAALIAATLGAEIVIMDNGISAGDVAGAAAGLVLWLLVARMPAGGAAVLAAALMIAFAYNGLVPFTLRASRAAFDFLPFHGYFRGSVWRGLVVMFERFYVYGSLVWLARASGLSWRAAIAGIAAFALGLEVAQIWFTGHVPELSDPVVVLITGLILWQMAAMGSARAAAQPAAAAPVSVLGRPALPPKDARVSFLRSGRRGATRRAGS